MRYTTQQSCKLRVNTPTRRLPRQSQELSPSLRSPLAERQSSSLSPSFTEVAAMAEAMPSQYEPSTSSSTVLPSECQESFGVATAMPQEQFLPAKGADYTESFEAQLRAELDEVGRATYKKLPIWGRCTDAPTRQRLVFRKEFINRRNVINTTNGKHRRALQIYRTGAAQRKPCANCSRGLGPFRKCVVDGEGSTLRGACTNCVFKEQGHDCKYHEKNRRHALMCRAEIYEVAGNSAETNALRPFKPPKRPRDLHQDHEYPSQDDERSSVRHEDRKKRRKEEDRATGKGPKPTPPKGRLRKPADTAPSLISSDVVFQSTTFKAGQASSEQVQYILKRCDANQRAFFTGAWLSWCSERTAQKRPQPFDGMESFLAEGWYSDLNEAISKVCPVQSKSRWTAG